MPGSREERPRNEDAGGQGESTVLSRVRVHRSGGTRQLERSRGRRKWSLATLQRAPNAGGLAGDRKGQTAYGTRRQSVRQS